MKLLRYELDWASHWGVLEGDTVHALLGDPYGDCGAGEAVGRVDDLTLLAPCTPRTIWSLGANYPSRCAERGFALPTEPSFLVAPGSCICGTGAEIRIPEHERRAEYGAELGIVARRDCRDVSEAEAPAYVLGYTALNNVWVKDPADAGDYARPLRVYDNHCPTGPVVDTAVDPHDLRVRLWVDGELRQDDRTSTVVFPPARVIAWLSQRVTIAKGDLIMTGTPGGVEGHTLRYGQTVAIAVEGIGRIENRVTRVDAAAATDVVGLKKWLESR